MNKPAIALQRRQAAIAKFSHKIDVLERLLGDGDLHRFPKRVSVSSFVSWEDEELGVQPISRSVVYDDVEEYLQLRKRMEVTLERLSHLRTKTRKKNNLELDLRLRLEDAEARAQAFKNQYSTAMAELAEARKEIEYLNLRLARQGVQRTKVVPLSGTKTAGPTEK